jgi:hypothetical protein
LTRTRLLGAALLAAPLLTTLAILTDPDGDVVGALVFIGLWTVFSAIWVGIAWLDLRRPASRGHAGFGAGIAAIVLALLLLVLGGVVVLPALCLILLAASLGTKRRMAVSATLLGVASLLYIGALLG